MMARRHQSKQWVAFRVLGVLQQGLQQSFTDGARDYVLADPDGDKLTSLAAPAKLPRAATRSKIAISFGEPAIQEFPS
jgi:hypothetical protein